MNKQEFVSLIGSVISCASQSMSLQDLRGITIWIADSNDFWEHLKPIVERGMKMGMEVHEELSRKK